MRCDPYYHDATLMKRIARGALRPYANIEWTGMKCDKHHDNAPGMTGRVMPLMAFGIWPFPLMKNSWVVVKLKRFLITMSSTLMDRINVVNRR